MKWVGPTQDLKFLHQAESSEALSQFSDFDRTELYETRPKNIKSKIWSDKSDRNHDIFKSMRSESWLRPLCSRPILLKILPPAISGYYRWVLYDYRIYMMMMSHM